MRNFKERKKEKCHNRLTGILKIDINVLCKCIDNENQDYFKKLRYLRQNLSHELRAMRNAYKMLAIKLDHTGNLHIALHDTTLRYTTLHL